MSAGPWQLSWMLIWNSPYSFSLPATFFFFANCCSFWGFIRWKPPAKPLLPNATSNVCPVDNEYLVPGMQTAIWETLFPEIEADFLLVESFCQWDDGQGVEMSKQMQGSKHKKRLVNTEQHLFHSSPRAYKFLVIGRISHWVSRKGRFCTQMWIFCFC